MLTQLLAPGNLPFAVALLVMLGIGLLEGVATVLGAGLSSAIDQLVPEADLDLDVEGPDLETPGVVTRFLGWLHVGRVPLLVLLVLFLLVFGLAGLFAQGVIQELTGRMLPAWIAGPAVAVAVLPVVRGAGGLLANVIPRDETSAVSVDSFVGRVATVTLGTARRGEPAQAKLRDRYGQVHYVMVEPDVEGESLAAGTAVLLVSRAGAVFRAIENPNPLLAG
jgi:hypothetical protein